MITTCSNAWASAWGPDTRSRSTAIAASKVSSSWKILLSELATSVDLHDNLREFALLVSFDLCFTFKQFVICKVETNRKQFFDGGRGSAVRRVNLVAAARLLFRWLIHAGKRGPLIPSASTGASVFIEQTLYGWWRWRCDSLLCSVAVADGLLWGLDAL